jgi:hypothetical protein
LMGCVCVLSGRLVGWLVGCEVDWYLWEEIVCMH